MKSIPSLLLLTALFCLNPVNVSCADDAGQLFEKRIRPIFQSPKPSSCTECHLAGVDLKQYIRPTQEETFAGLVQRNLVDLNNPGKSKILEFIARKPKETTLVSDKVRKQEYEAFKSWIVAAAKDPALIRPSKSVQSGPTVPVEVIRHARTDRVLKSFIDNVWSEVGRCAGCHSPDRNQKQVKEHGEQVSWITLNDPEATMQYLLDADIIDTDKPEKSLLLLKPTNQVKHGGGIKLQVGDRTYRQFLTFIKDYAKTVHGEYTSADQLPDENPELFQVTDIWFKLEGVPEEFHQKLLRVNLYRQTGDGPNSFSRDRWATADRGVFGPKKLWQNHLSLAAPRGSHRAEEIRKRPVLPPGKYLVEVLIDKTGKLAADPTAELDESDVVGRTVVESRFPPGYGRMTVAQYPSGKD